MLLRFVFTDHIYFFVLSREFSLKKQHLVKLEGKIQEWKQLAIFAEQNKQTMYKQNKTKQNKKATSHSKKNSVTDQMA